MLESDFMRRLQMQATRLGARLFRQNVGLAWVGRVERGPPQGRRTVHLGPGDVVIRKARPFHVGFEGMSDLGGWVPVIVTPDMVGQTLAVVVQVEVKMPGRKATLPQLAWLDAVRNAGGRAGLARTENDLALILGANVDGS